MRIQFSIKPYSVCVTEHPDVDIIAIHGADTENDGYCLDLTREKAQDLYRSLYIIFGAIPDHQPTKLHPDAPNGRKD